MRRILTTGLVLGSFLLPTATAWAQMESREAIDLQNQILEMRRDLQQVQQQPRGEEPQTQSAIAPPVASEGGGGSGGDLVPQLLERVQTLEDQVRTLRGKVDELQNQSTRSQQDLAKQLGDLQFQIQNGQGGGQSTGQGIGSGGGQTAAPTDNGASPPPAQSPAPRNLSVPQHSSENITPARPVSNPQAKRSADALVHDANSALQHRDYRAAENAARDLQQTGKRAYDAQFIMAQAKAGERDYKGAAIAYDDTYNHNRHGTWAQDSLLGVAVSLYNLGDNKAACAAIRRVQAEFPTQRADVQRNVSALRGRAGC
jgi:TolA-binding protein